VSCRAARAYGPRDAIGQAGTFQAATWFTVESPACE
jgi:hypothetical protein